MRYHDRARDRAMGIIKAGTAVGGVRAPFLAIVLSVRRVQPVISEGTI